MSSPWRMLHSTDAGGAGEEDSIAAFDYLPGLEPVETALQRARSGRSWLTYAVFGDLSYPQMPPIIVLLGRLWGALQRGAYVTAKDGAKPSY